MRALIVFGLILMLLPSVAAATPQLISVHGKMTDIFGNNITGPYDMAFRMYTQETEGAAIWTETWNAGTEKVTFGADGYFSVLIGSHNSLDLPFDTQYWLEIQVQSDVLAPRFKLGAVPYTFRANVTENLAAGAKAAGSLNMNSFDITGAGGIYGTTLYEGGTALSSKYLSTSSFGTNFLGWTNLTDYPAACPAGEFITILGDTVTCAEPSVAGIGGWTDDGTIVRLTTPTDNVGIGTLNPQAKLHIAGGSLLVNNSISTGSPNLGIFRNDASGGNTLFLGVGATGTVLGANRVGLGDATSYRIVWDTANGNVGIGTSDPLNRLDVVGNVNATGNLYGLLGTAGAVSTTNIADSAVTAAKLASDLGLGWQNLTDYPNTCGTGKAIQAVGDTLTCISLSTGNTSGSGTMNYVTKWADFNTTTDSIIYDDGVRIGIGTEIPVKKLDVVGDINATGYVYGMTGVCIGTDCKTDWAQVTGTASPWDNSSTQTFIRDGYPLFVNVSNTLFVNETSGKVGIGTAMPERKLSVNGDAVINDQLFKTLDNGVFLGRTRVSENQWALSNVGADWSQKTSDATRLWGSVSISSDGKYQTAAVRNGYIYGSSDYGATWSQKTSDTTRNWYSVSISSDGKYQTAVVDTGYIYGSSDYGATWSQKTSDTTRFWGSVSISSDGKYQTAVVWNGYIYGSSDYGATWSQKTSDTTRNWYSVSISSDGKYQTAVASGDYIYGSSDYGATWSQKTSDATRSWYSVSISSDGKYQTAVAAVDYIYGSVADSYIAFGNVGIGTADPQKKLDVVGDANVTGTIYQGGNTVLDTSTTFSGDAVGSYNSLLLGAGVVTNTKIAAYAVNKTQILGILDHTVVGNLYGENITQGTIASARMNGVYLGITGVGTQAQNMDLGGYNITNTDNLNITSITLSVNCEEGQILKWSNGIGICGTDIGGEAEGDNLQTITGRGNTTTHNMTIGAATLAQTMLDVVGDANVTGTIYQGGNTVLDTSTTFSGDVSGTYGSINIASTTVSAGDYGGNMVIPTYTVDADGRITLASNTTIRLASIFVTGIVRLDNTVLSTSNTTAATANATKTAYDTATAKASPGTCPTGQAVQNTTTGGVECIDFSSGGEVEGAGSTGYIARWNSSTTINASAIYQLGTNIGIGTTEPNETMHVVGNIAVTPGYDICIDGGNCLSGAGSVFYNKTAATYTGSLSFGGFTGYKAGDAICNASFEGTHLCSMAEISYTIATRNLSVVIGWVGEAWIATGPAKYSPASLPVNDCNGFAHGAAGSYLGNWWAFDQSTGGTGKTGNCGNTLSVGCCK